MYYTKRRVLFDNYKNLHIIWHFYFGLYVNKFTKNNAVKEGPTWEEKIT